MPRPALSARSPALFLALCLSLSACPGKPDRESAAAPPAKAAAAGGPVRQAVDLVGYTHTAEGIGRVVEHSLDLEARRMADIRTRLSLGPDTCLAAAISPHDDYLYAQQVYVHVFPYLKAQHVIIIGVTHRGRHFPESEGKIVLDSHAAWQGPYGPAAVSPLREELASGLEPGDFMVSDEMHASEHSLEALLPFLQHFNREAAILPVLVSFMSWERLADLAGRTASALAAAMHRRSFALGQDVAILISSDSVHYGDEDWGGREFAEFGTSGAGYDQAVARDLALIADHLAGPLTAARLEGFYRRVVADDIHDYRITWCGRFSIPFGLLCAARLAEGLGRPGLRGELLRYGTTLDPGRADLDVAGLGVTARASLHHWVGFAALAYW